MDKLQNDFTGMMITLKKRIMCIDRDDTKDYQYLMFGHYDGMDIVCTDNWYQLRPKGVEESGGNVDIRDSLSDKYTLKLYFPDRKYCEGLEKKGFSYDIWRKMGYYEEYAKQCDNVLEQFPFISVAMINLSRECVEAEDDLTAKIQSSIAEAIEVKHENMEDIHCAIMPSIGYADFVLLFLSNHLKKVITVLDYLRKASVQVGERQYAMLSNSYAISGFAQKGLTSLQDRNDLDNVKLSIRVNLRDGVSAAQFKKYFDDKMKLVKQERAVGEADRTHSLYQVFGNSDCLILSDMPFDFFIPLFYDEKLLNPGHELFKRFIRYTRSSIRVEIDSEEEEISLIDGHSKNTYMQYQKKFACLIDRLKGYVTKYNLPVRTINGLQTVMKTYLNLIQFSHCFDIEKIIGDTFEALEDNVERTIELAEKESEDAEWYFEQMMQALKFFREKVEDYLADLRRSDRLFIEGQALSHPSIGSATKLLFFYNKYVNDMANRLTGVERDGRNARYTFMVTSGGCDVTTAIDVFSYMDPAEESLHSLIIVLIPEMSLYDFRGTMFRLLHECFHFCGERMREERLNALLRSLSENTALTIGEWLAGSLRKQFYQRIYISIQQNFERTERRKIDECGRKIIAERLQELNGELANKIHEELKEKFDTSNISSYYGRNLYPDVLEILKKDILASDDVIDENRLLGRTYRGYIECQKAMAEDLIAYFGRKGIPFSKANILRETALQKQKMLQEGKLDLEEVRLIQAVFKMTGESTAFENDRVYLEESEQVTIEDIIENLENIFKECFADCMAVEVLKLPMEDFILCFIYETWSIEKVFSDFLRIAIEMKVLYGIQGGLSEDDRKKIKRKVKYWKKEGFSYRNIEVVCDRINMALEEYNGRGYEGFKYVEDYLCKCRSFYAEKSLEEEEISRLFNRVSSKNMNVLLNEVHGMWKKIAEDGRD